MYLAKELTNLTLESIGLNFGGKDHATVLYAHNIVTILSKRQGNIKSNIRDKRNFKESLIASVSNSIYLFKLYNGKICL